MPEIESTDITRRGTTRIRIAAILTRSIPAKPGFGREKVLSEIRIALNKGFQVTEFRLHHALELRLIGNLLGCAWQSILGVLTGRPIPLQSAIYAGADQIHRIVQAIEHGQFEAVYVDSIRSQRLVRELRKRLPGIRIIVDFDDLMSRRSEQHLRARVPLSLGFLQSLLPKILQRLIAGPFRILVTRYEAFSLHCAEAEISEAADAIVLVSSAERDIFEKATRGQRRAEIFAVAPPFSIQRKAVTVVEPYRFIFIGSDLLVQNRLSIDYLIRVWRDTAPKTPLHIFGKQQGVYPRIPNVNWHGFVDDLSDVYTPGSILALPALIAGGVKTKVAEAWSYGCPVLGNSQAFEGYGIAEYPLDRPLDEWTPYIQNPGSFLQTWISAATIGHEFVKTTLDPEDFYAAWRLVLSPENLSLARALPDGKQETPKCC
jgi:glycosyltransferase involved in cell wall biosynthesis